MLIVQPGDLHVGVHIGVVNDLADRLLVGTSFFDRFDKNIFAMERRIFTIWSYPEVPISEIPAHSAFMAVSQSDADAGTDTEPWKDISERTSVFRVATIVAIPLNAQATEEVTICSTGSSARRHTLIQWENKWPYRLQRLLIPCHTSQYP